MANNNKSLQLADVSRFGRWQALYLSFYSSALYIDVAKRWRGLGLIYLLLMVMLTTFVYSIKNIIDYNAKFEEQFILVLRELPKITVTEGRVSIDEPMPYSIKNKKGDVIAMIDTKALFSKVKQENPHLILFIGADTIYSLDRVTQNNKNPVVILDNPKKISEPVFSSKKFSQEMNGTFVAQDILKPEKAMYFKWGVDFMLYLTLSSLLFTFYAFLFFTLAFIGQIIARLFFHVSLSYAAAFRLLVVAATPQAVIFFPLLTFDLLPQGSGIVFLILFLGYFSYALVCLRRANRVMVRV